MEPERSRRLEGKKVGHEARNETATGRKAGGTTREENARLRSVVGTSRKRARFVNTRAPRRAKLSWLECKQSEREREREGTGERWIEKEGGR